MMPEIYVDMAEGRTLDQKRVLLGERPPAP